MFKGQFIIYSDENLSKPENFALHKFLNYTICAHHDLNITIEVGSTVSVALIGFILDPIKPKSTNEDILKQIAHGSKTIKDVINATLSLSGRYVIVIKIGSNFFALGDAYHYRQIYYGRHSSKPILTSSVKLFLHVFGLNQSINEELESLLQSPFYQKTEHSWFGDWSEDTRLKKLLPNHLLHLDTLSKQRIPYYMERFNNESEILEYAQTVLKGTYDALTSQFKLFQPVTCGLDTRLLLAASKHVKEKINYYIFDRSGGKSVDVEIARKLNEQLGLELSVICPRALDDFFLEKYKPEHCNPRILSKTENIQYHFYANYPKNALNISGNGAGIYKVPFGLFKGNVNIDQVLTFSGYYKKVPFITEQLSKWLLEARIFAKDIGVSVSDLFYWEQRMGNWGSLYPFEQDLAIEECSPYNNRSLLLALLQINPNRRKSPNYRAIRQLIKSLWPETLSEPINPDSNFLWKYIKGSGPLRYMVLKANHLNKEWGYKDRRK